MRSSIRVVEAVKHRVPRGLYPVARTGYHRIVVPLQCLAVDIADRTRGRTYDGRRLPPARLRLKVRGTPSGQDYARVGHDVAWSVFDALRRAGVDLARCRTILDFGCGPGSTIMWLRELAPRAAITGTDIDAAAIGWAVSNMPGLTFHVNRELPPLPYPDGAFDLVYAISVFTHFDERRQLAWLGELRRVLRPGGMCVVSLHGPDSWPGMPAADRETLLRDGFAFVRNQATEGLFPEWYQAAFHTPGYVERTFSQGFQVVARIPPTMDRRQNLIVLRRPELEGSGGDPA